MKIALSINRDLSILCVAETIHLSDSEVLLRTMEPSILIKVLQSVEQG